VQGGGLDEGRPVTNIAIVGVGGQGILLASELLAQAALGAGYAVKKNELHGMAQRGGSVVSEVRFGETVYSPVIPEGAADGLVALELLEALRGTHRLRAGGFVVADDLRIRPSVSPPGAPAYPEDVCARLQRAREQVLVVQATQLARQAGTPRAANVVLLGALSRRLPFPEEAWQRALECCLRPDLLGLNQRAFELGRAAAPGELSSGVDRDGS
jgi:indolepyruvate ferredoxin oxidoreductase beta subunit